MTVRVRFYGTLIIAHNITTLRCQAVLILVITALDPHPLYQASVLYRNIHNIHRNIHLRTSNAFMKRTSFLKLN
jgi:hypothetical protein